MKTFLNTDEKGNIISRIVKLETKFEELDKAIILAKDHVEKEKILARTQLDAHLLSINQFQKRMDKLEATFATIEYVYKTVEDLKSFFNLEIKYIKNSAESTNKSLSETIENTKSNLYQKIEDSERSLESRLNGISKYVYIGIGIAIILQLVFQIVLQYIIKHIG